MKGKLTLLGSWRHGRGMLHPGIYHVPRDLGEKMAARAVKEAGAIFEEARRAAPAPILPIAVAGTEPELEPGPGEAEDKSSGDAAADEPGEPEGEEHREPGKPARKRRPRSTARRPAAKKPPENKAIAAPENKAQDGAQDDDAGAGQTDTD